MQLTKVRILNYRSVEDSGEFSIDKVTCLVGKNESGKTALMQALYKLNPHVEADGQYDVQREYPRRYQADFAERHPKGTAPVIETVWTLDSDDTKELMAVIGPEAEKIKSIRVSKGYGSPKQTWDLSVDEGAVVKHVLSTSGLFREEADQLSGTATIAGLKAALVKLGASASERQKALAARIERDFKGGTASLAVIHTLEMPKFLYFPQYERMSGQVAVEALLQRKAQNRLTEDDRVFLALCDLAGTTVEEIQSMNQFEPIISKFEAASNKVSGEIFRYWTQNRHLKVQFRVDQALPGDPPPLNSGRIVRTRVYNNHHEVSVPFDERSTGFVWFFSFIALFSQVKKTHGDDVIILLDEPGLSLHAKAQTDLLRYFDERLAPRHQVIFTTHSPFMVPTDRLLSVRTVEDVVIDKDGVVEVLGTKVGDDVLSTDRDTLFPLQGALGYEITQSLFVGEHTLLVEGPSDILYMKAMSEELQARGRTGLDRRWTLCPAGGVEKVSAFMSLFGGNKLHVAVFIDYAHGHKKRVDELRRSKLLREGHVLTAEGYAGQPEADIEDILGGKAYVEIVNRCYGLKPPRAATAPPAGTRVLKAVEEQLRVLPDAPDFDHFTPAWFFFENRPKLFQDIHDLSGALDAFERLFKDLNRLLPAR
jgi:predicted ATPase